MSAPESSSSAPTPHLHLRWKDALEAAGVGTWSWELGAKVVMCDACAHQLFGLAGRDTAVPAGQLEAAIHADDLPAVRTAVLDSIQSAGDFHCEFRVAGTAPVRFLRAKGKVYRDPNGTALGITGACWDITQRAAIEAELAHERFLLRTLLEHMPDKIYFKDRQSRFTRVSNALANWHCAADTGSVIGKTDFDFFSSEHARQAFEDEQQIIRTGKPLVGVEEKETWADGHETWASTTKLPLFDSAGAIIGTFGISRDITDRRRAESQLARYTAELQTRNAELEEDLAMARELQVALLPQTYPCFPHGVAPENSLLRFSHFFNASQAVSGDFFDILELSDNTAGVFICDVMGHGMRAALVAAIVRALVSELRGIAKTPGEFLSRLNRKLFRILKQTGITVFATAAYVVVDVAKGELRYSNAGHPDPIWVSHKKEGAQTLPLNHCRRGPALGLFEDAQYGTSRSSLSDHDTVLLFTDGLFEVEGVQGDFFNQERLFHAVDRRAHLAPAELCKEVLDEVQQFSADNHFSDDVCMVAIEVERGKKP